MKKKRVPIFKWLAVVLMISGLLLLLYPIIGNYVANRERSEAVTAYDDSMKKLSAEARAQQLAQAKAYNQFVFDKQEGHLTKAVDYKSVMNYGSVMGTVDIPAIDIHAMPFYHGTSYQTLDKGLGHFEPSSLPIGGENTRAVITGHSGVKNQVLFTDIRNLREGDLFFINILGQRLAYRIDRFEEILPDEVDKVKISPGKDQVTLLTCTPPGINTYRLLVTGNRIPYKEAMAQKMVKRNLWSYQHLVFLTLGTCLGLFALLVGFYQYYARKFRSADPRVSERARRQLKRLFLATKILFITVFIGMLAVLAVAGYGYFKMAQNQDPIPVEVGRDQQLSQYNLAKIEQANYEEHQIASVKISEYAQAKGHLRETVNQAGIGKLVIPKVGIDLPILAGLNNQNLLSGVATFRQSQQLGRGNYVLLAHNMFEKDVLLHRIQDLQVGDSLYATDFEQIYRYVVSFQDVVEDTEVSYIEEAREVNPPLITLVRCEGDIGTPYRRVAQGELAEVIPLQQADAGLLKQLALTRQKANPTSEWLTREPVSPLDHASMTLSAAILSDPMKTAIPLFFMLLVPILFFCFI